METITLAELFEQFEKCKKLKTAKAKATLKYAKEDEKADQMRGKFGKANLLYQDTITGKTYFFDGWKFSEVNEEVI